MKQVTRRTIKADQSHYFGCPLIYIWIKYYDILWHRILSSTMCCSFFYLTIFGITILDRIWYPLHYLKLTNWCKEATQIWGNWQDFAPVQTVMRYEELKRIGAIKWLYTEWLKVVELPLLIWPVSYKYSICKWNAKVH